MYKLLLILPLLLLFTGCAQQAGTLSLNGKTHTSAYSLAALDARYQQGR